VASIDTKGGGWNSKGKSMESSFMLVSWGSNYGSLLSTSSFSLKVTSKIGNFPSSSVTSRALSEDELFNFLGFNGMSLQNHASLFF
jgi:hypothetical protein